MKEDEQKQIFFNSIKNNIKDYDLSVIKIEATEDLTSFKVILLSTNQKTFVSIYSTKIN